MTLRGQKPGWWNPQEGALVAADSFETKFTEQRGLAVQQFEQVQASERRRGGTAHQTAYSHNVGRLSGHRYVVQPLRVGVPPNWSGPRYTPPHMPDQSIASESSGPWVLDGEAWWELEGEAGLRQRKQRWKLSDSVWFDRKQTGNSKVGDALNCSGAGCSDHSRVWPTPPLPLLPPPLSPLLPPPLPASLPSHLPPAQFCRTTTRPSQP